MGMLFGQNYRKRPLWIKVKQSEKNVKIQDRDRTNVNLECAFFHAISQYLSQSFSLKILLGALGSGSGTCSVFYLFLFLFGQCELLSNEETCHDNNDNSFSLNDGGKWGSVRAFQLELQAERNNLGQWGVVDPNLPTWYQFVAVYSWSIAK